MDTTKAPITHDEALKKCIKLEKQLMVAIRLKLAASPAISVFQIRYIDVNTEDDHLIVCQLGDREPIKSVHMDKFEDVYVTTKCNPPVKVDQGVQSTIDLITILKAVS